MNIREFGYIIHQSQKANWDDKDFQTFVWNMSKMIDDNPDEWDLTEPKGK